MSSNGYVLYEDSSIVTVVTLKSENRKTGNMAQVWILTANESPLEAVKSGGDRDICGTCPLRPLANGGCYVEVGKAPMSIWKAWKKGKYPKADTSVLRGKKVRIGAYGDPAFLPESLINDIIQEAESHTAYTHQWRQAHWLKGIAMASCENEQDARKAYLDGWGVFLLRKRGTETSIGEQCLGGCEYCMKCNGKSSIIWVEAHGYTKGRVDKLIQIKEK